MQFNYDAYKAGFQMPTKKTQEQELMEKMKLLNYQSQLQDSQLGDLEKRYRLMKSDPEGFQSLMLFNNIMTPYQEGMLNLQRSQAGADSMTPQQKNYEYLKKHFPNMPEEELLIRSGLKAPEQKKAISWGD